MLVGVNALYLIPGGVGGTEIYLRNLLRALAAIDHANQYVVFTNRETGPDLVPPSFTHAPLPVNATNRPARLLYEQTGLAMEARRRRIDVMFNPGFTAPAFPGCPNVTVFHDLQHKRHPRVLPPLRSARVESVPGLEHSPIEGSGRRFRVDWRRPEAVLSRGR